MHEPALRMLRSSAPTKSKTSSGTDQTASGRACSARPSRSCARSDRDLENRAIPILDYEVWSDTRTGIGRLKGRIVRGKYEH